MTWTLLYWLCGSVVGALGGWYVASLHAKIWDLRIENSRLRMKVFSWETYDKLKTDEFRASFKAAFLVEEEEEK